MKPFALPSFCYPGDTGYESGTACYMPMDSDAHALPIICFSYFVDYDTIVFITLSCLFLKLNTLP